MPSITPQVLIDAARARHWSFSQSKAGDGAALLYLQQRVRTFLATYGSAIEGLIGSSVSYIVPLQQPSLLVTESGSVIVTNWLAGFAVTNPPGFPTAGVAHEDGWPVSVDGGGNYYVDFTTPPIAGDPFGLFGGTPGFPLPVDMVRLTTVMVTMDYPPYEIRECFVVPETQRVKWPFREKIGAFVATNRLVPIRHPVWPPQAEVDLWSRIKSITISYVPLQQFATLNDIINFPAVLADALIADLATYFAGQTQECPDADRQRFDRKLAEVLAALEEPSHLALYQGQQPSSVRYRGR